jgi:anti-sigma regulatory factor (Ser/Thr protein kinase)
MTQQHILGSLTFPARTEYLAELGLFIHALCDTHPQVVLLELAVSEAITNAIKHGQATSCRVRIRRGQENLQITVEDNGKGFDTTLAQPRSMGELREGNYGLAIIHKVSETLNYRYQKGWNQLTLTFSVPVTVA